MQPGLHNLVGHLGNDGLELLRRCALDGFGGRSGHGATSAFGTCTPSAWPSQWYGSATSASSLLLHHARRHAPSPETWVMSQRHHMHERGEKIRPILRAAPSRGTGSTPGIAPGPSCAVLRAISAASWSAFDAYRLSVPIT